MIGRARVLLTTPEVTGASAALPVTVDASGVQQLDLVVNDTGDSHANDHSDWADATLACAD